MLVRFTCPACGRSHSFDMPETTIPMTCATTAKTLSLRLGKDGEVRASIIGEAEATADGEQD